MVLGYYTAALARFITNVSVICDTSRPMGLVLLFLVQSRWPPMHISDTSLDRRSRPSRLRSGPFMIVTHIFISSRSCATYSASVLHSSSSRWPAVWVAPGRAEPAHGSPNGTDGPERDNIGVKRDQWTQKVVGPDPTGQDVLRRGRSWSFGSVSAPPRFLVTDQCIRWRKVLPTMISTALNPASVIASPFFSQGVEVRDAGRLVFVAGQVGMTADGTVREGNELMPSPARKPAHRAEATPQRDCGRTQG